MKINKYDSNIKIIDVNNTCQPETKTFLKFFVYLNNYVNQNIDESDFQHMLESFGSNQLKSVITQINDESNIDSIDELETYLDYYDMTLDDCTYDDVKSFISDLKKKRSNQIINIEQANKEFQTFLRNPSQIVTPKIPFITNSTIKELKPQYGEYPTSTNLQIVFKPV